MLGLCNITQNLEKFQFVSHTTKVLHVFNVNHISHDSTQKNYHYSTDLVMINHSDLLTFFSNL